jgi:hypothetical protein
MIETAKHEIIKLKSIVKRTAIAERSVSPMRALATPI